MSVTVQRPLPWTSTSWPSRLGVSPPALRAGIFSSLPSSTTSSKSVPQSRLPLTLLGAVVLWVPRQIMLPQSQRKEARGRGRWRRSAALLAATALAVAAAGTAASPDSSSASIFDVLQGGAKPKGTAGPSLIPAAGGPWASSVRVVAMSDTHGFHRGLTVPEGDLLIHCGDASVDGKKKGHGIEDLAGFSKWFKRLPHKEKVFIQGNHDSLGESRALLGKAWLTGPRICCGLQIFGMPHHSAGMGYGHVPGGLDLLLSHEPPYGILDLATPGNRYARIGSRKILQSIGRAFQSVNCTMEDGIQQEFLEELAPPLVHIFGHVHEARGYETENRTLFVNAANANPGRAKRLENTLCVVVDIATDGSGEVRVARGGAKISLVC
ncbi:unnamed protein product [Polarella glacialis]|uniref:Calcineurin-like phosphoesterase domain-containing protein n=1 Tax=Polarella glacialis TaxID=89957 RepID=A0A813DA44_POLGL|nr:unnamed protein product [Polarella glacialis]